MLQEEIDKECRKYGKKLAIYLKANLEEALQKSGKSVQEASLTFNELITQTQDGVNIKIIATDSYWAYIDRGVDGTKTKHGSPFEYTKGAISFDAVGKKWQNKHNINPQKVLAEIELKYQNSKSYSRLSSTGERLSKPKKELTYDEAAGRLSRIIAVAIARDGLTPKPFVQQAIKEAKVDEFQKKISEIMGKSISVQLQLNNEFKPIKLNF